MCAVGALDQRLFAILKSPASAGLFFARVWLRFGGFAADQAFAFSRKDFPQCSCVIFRICVMIRAFSTAC
ncbi:MAG: hypothetical protein AVDCRST_MAG42-1575 [uncultured Chthoniobacterales bacterium]|uniref:Uncharacterized protein n=1 Tax=uncultured Chthoniobacterales bacterium TaxID=1836801 RepID=A0A6J4I0W0_9BACT|nr:MAG: hypothetical protein AVDCRST_MAG42-1575 [uncultured Chthoniobacterales bacterium]